MDATDPFALKRKEMVDRQLIARNIVSPIILKSFLLTPRHRFISPSLEAYAYEDAPLPIEEGQTISQPYVVALMLQAAELDPEAIVLEIGTGSGYAAALLSHTVKKVYTVERLASLSEKAQKTCRELEYENIEFKVGDGSLGWLEKAPYDAIIVAAGAPATPQSLLYQLKTGGRLIIPVGDRGGQRLVRYRKTAASAFEEELLEFVRFVPLIGEEGWKKQ